MSYTIKQRFVHMAPRKLRLVADVVRGQTMERAVTQLMVTPRIAAQPILAAVKAAANAAKQQNETGKLYVKAILVDEGPAMKRRLMRSRGRSSRMEHRMSHITVTVAPVEAPTAAKKPAKKNGEES